MSQLFVTYKRDFWAIDEYGADSEHIYRLVMARFDNTYVQRIGPRFANVAEAEIPWNWAIV